MMNKKKLCIIIVIAIIVTGLAVTFAVLSKSGKHKESVNAESTVNNEKQPAIFRERKSSRWLTWKAALIPQPSFR